VVSGKSAKDGIVQQRGSWGVTAYQIPLFTMRRSTELTLKSHKLESKKVTCHR
jgi:hypothetical protein